MTRNELIAAVLADADALWAIRQDETLVLSPWKRLTITSERQGSEWNDEYGEPMWRVVVKHYRASRNGVRCEAECDKPGRGSFCSECGRPLIHEAGRRAWRVEWLPHVARSLPQSNPIPDFDSREEAEQWCDARLREAGVLLAGGGT